MMINEALRFVAGIMILISLLLVQFHSQNWLWFTAFIGVNLRYPSYLKMQDSAGIRNVFRQGIA